MDYIYIFFFITVILIIIGIILYFFLKSPGKINSAVPESKKTGVKESSETSSRSAELIALKQELMTIVLHNQRTYENNLQIARKDFSRRNVQNPSEAELLRRAIEIWRDDNR